MKITAPSGNCGRDRDRTGDPLLAKQGKIKSKSLFRLRLTRQLHRKLLRRCSKTGTLPRIRYNSRLARTFGIYTMIRGGRPAMQSRASKSEIGGWHNRRERLK
jgi:hypothetical protein